MSRLPTSEGLIGNYKIWPQSLKFDDSKIFEFVSRVGSVGRLFLRAAKNRPSEMATHPQFQTPNPKMKKHACDLLSNKSGYPFLTKDEADL